MRMMARWTMFGVLLPFLWTAGSASAGSGPCGMGPGGGGAMGPGAMCAPGCGHMGGHGGFAGGGPKPEVRPSERRCSRRGRLRVGTGRGP